MPIIAIGHVPQQPAGRQDDDSTFALIWTL
jgi:hypothetical protein